MKCVIFCTWCDGHLALCDEDDPERKVTLTNLTFPVFIFLIKMSGMSPLPFLIALQLAVGNFPKPQSHLGEEPEQQFTFSNTEV